MKKYFYKALKWELPSFLIIVVMAVAVDFATSATIGQ